MVKKENQPKEKESIDDTAPKQFEERSPIVTTNISTSKDKKWVIHKTIITDLKPITYYEKVIGKEE